MTSSQQPSWNDLHILISVIAAGSLTRAASHVGLSQPTLSRRLKALEKSLNVSLFHKLPSGLEPTPLARRFAELLTPTQDAVALVQRLAATEAELKKSIRLTTTTTLSIVLSEHWPSIVPATAAVGLDIQCTRQSVDLLRREGDIAIRLRRPPQRGPLKVRKIGALGFAVYSSRHQSKDKATHRFIGLSDNRPLPQKDWFDAYVKRSGGEIFFRVGEVFQRLAAMKSGPATSLLPCILGDREPGVKRQTPAIEDLSEDIFLIIHEDVAQRPEVREVATGVTKVFREMAGALAGKL